MESKISTQITILGGGPAGYVAAIRSSQLGGVCLNKGCISTKALLKTSEVSYVIKKSNEFGIDSSSSINWNISNERKNRVVKNLNMGLEHLLPTKEIVILKGKGYIEP